MSIAPIVFDPREDTFRDRTGKVIQIRPRTKDVFFFLASNSGRLVYKSEIMKKVWLDRAVTEDVLTQSISELRKLLGDQAHSLIKTIHKKGFVFSNPIEYFYADNIKGQEVRDLPLSKRLVLNIIPLQTLGSMSRFRDYFVSKVVALLVNSPLEIYLRNTPEFCELGLEGKLSFDLYMSINENDLGLSLDAYLLERQSRRVRWSLRREWHHSAALEQANILCEQICAAVRENMLDGPNIYFAQSETENIAALIAFHGGLMSHRKFTRDNNLSSRTQAMEAIKHDPDFSSGWSLLARCFVAESRLGWSDAPRESLRLGHEAALRAVDLNPRSAEAWSALGLIRLHQHDHEAALKCSSKVLDLSSACPESIALSAMIENYCGRYDIGLSQIEQAISSAPCCPGYFHGIKMVSLRMQDRIQEAIVAENINLEKNPINPCSDLRLSVAFSQLGDFERAKTHTKKALYKNPSYSKNCLVYTEPYRAEKETMRYISHLFKAGLPSS